MRKFRLRTGTEYSYSEYKMGEVYDEGFKADYDDYSVGEMVNLYPQDWEEVVDIAVSTEGITVSIEEVQKAFEYWKFDSIKNPEKYQSKDVPSPSEYGIVAGNEFIDIINIIKGK